MWSHVAKQMLVPGGLGQKREDWVEHHHQFGSQLRQQFESTKDLGVRAHAMAGRHQMDTNPGVEAQERHVNSRWETGPRAHRVSLEATRKEARMNKRWEVIQQWERDTEDSAVPVAEKLDWDDASNDDEDDPDELLRELENDLC